MKYLEIYDGFTNKELLNREISISKYAPESYIIFLYDTFSWKDKKSSNNLILGKIDFIHGTIPGTRVRIKIVDIVEEYENKILGSDFNIDKIKEGEKFLSNSLKMAQYQFDLLKNKEPYSNWIINKDAKKFNI